MRFRPACRQASRSGLPSSGGPPLDGASGSAWTHYLAIDGALLLAAGNAVLVASTVR